MPALTKDEMRRALTNAICFGVSLALTNDRIETPRQRRYLKGLRRLAARLPQRVKRRR